MTNNAAETAVEILNPGGQGNFVLVCDHASNAFPAEYGSLGLDAAECARHIAYDIGAAEVTRILSRELDAPAVLARWSRLLIDVNRDTASPTLIPEVSDGTEIPGNRDMTDAERERRIRDYYIPFHEAVDQTVRAAMAGDRVPIVMAVHSFTPVMNGRKRPWHVGLLWNRDPRLAARMIEAYEARGFTVGDNEPYSGRHLFYTMDRHGARHGLPQATLEIRQDEVTDAAGIARWAEITAAVLREIATEPELRIRRVYG